MLYIKIYILYLLFHILLFLILYEDFYLILNKNKKIMFLDDMVNLMEDIKILIFEFFYFLILVYLDLIHYILFVHFRLFVMKLSKLRQNMKMN